MIKIIYCLETNQILHSKIIIDSNDISETAKKILKLFTLMNLMIL